MRKKQRKNKEEKATLREKMAEALDVSKEVILDAVKLTVIGNGEMTVENYKSIAEYTENKIVLEAKPERVLVSGRNLEIKSLAKEMLYITGRVFGIEFKREV